MKHLKILKKTSVAVAFMVEHKKYKLYWDGSLWSYTSKRYLKGNKDKNGYTVYMLCRRNIKLHALEAHLKKLKTQ